LEVEVVVKDYIRHGAAEYNFKAPIVFLEGHGYLARAGPFGLVPHMEPRGL
jgi:hypothetical protein